MKTYANNIHGNRANLLVSGTQNNKKQNINTAKIDYFI
jgi:hypothetical protein